MIYQYYQAQADLLDPLRKLARTTSALMRTVMPHAPYGIMLRHYNAALEVFGHAGVTHARPAFGIKSIAQGNELVKVTEETVFETPFAGLLHFKKDTERKQPKVLVVSPLSGHFATLLRNTVETLLRDHDVYITDWTNARDVPVSAGIFGFDEYVEHVIKFLEHMGPRSHVVGVCQPTVAVLAAVSIMSEDNNPATPRSMTLMAGPIDTRRNPTRVNRLAKTKDIGWFEDKMIGIVPWRYRGGGRRVYPGFMQLTAFVSMNLERHIKSHVDLANHLAKGEKEKAEIIKTFYDEYFAVMDLPAEFYIETIRDVFQEHLLPQGKLTWRGRRVNPASIKRMGLMTVEGEKDDICSIGQTLAAQDLCTGVRAYRKVHHMQAGVGHYGVFSGKRWNNEIYPLLRDFVHVNS